MTRTLEDWLLDNGYGAIQQQQPLGGGSINDVHRLHTSRGTIVLKQNPTAPHDMFLAEAEGLMALAATGAIKVPTVLHQEQDFLLLEDLGRSPTGSDYWAQLGEQLAALHSQVRPQFGFTMDNYCGATRQLNPLLDEGHDFFAEYRLMALGRRAFEAGLMDTTHMQQLESVATRLERLVPQQAAVLIHGDLWSGNIHCDHRGQPALIDPACYWGWAEAELAMTTLFGGFAPGFYEAYATASGMDAGWQERASLYNLYHLLNHLLLFGGSYLRSVISILNRYSD